MILECDLGNSRCKWRLVKSGSVIDRGIVSNEQLASGIFPSDQKVLRVKAAAVTSDKITNQFELLCRESLGVEVEWAQPSAYSSGVHSGYLKPWLLGVDRWLALVAAYNIKGAAIVIDAGSALTVDVVNAKGDHLGGFIAPGAALMVESLKLHTAKVQVELTVFPEQISLGLETSVAVNSGIRAAQLGVVNKAIELAAAAIDNVFAVLITGGGAEAIAEDLSLAYEVYPDLVLDGLQWVLP